MGSDATAGSPSSSAEDRIPWKIMNRGFICNCQRKSRLAAAPLSADECKLPEVHCSQEVSERWLALLCVGKVVSLERSAMSRFLFIPTREPGLPHTKLPFLFVFVVCFFSHVNDSGPRPCWGHPSSVDIHPLTAAGQSRLRLPALWPCQGPSPPSTPCD